MYYVNDVDFTRLPVDLQDKIEEQGKRCDFLLTCPNCGSQEIHKTDLTECGDFVYECDDCDEVFSVDQIIVK